MANLPRAIFQPIGSDRSGWMNLGDFTVTLIEAADAAADHMGNRHVEAFRVLRTDFDDHGIPCAITDVTDDAKECIAEWHQERGDDLPDWLADDEDFQAYRAAGVNLRRQRAANRLPAE